MCMYTNTEHIVCHNFIHKLEQMGLSKGTHFKDKET